MKSQAGSLVFKPLGAQARDVWLVSNTNLIFLREEALFVEFVFIDAIFSLREFSKLGEVCLTLLRFEPVADGVVAGWQSLREWAGKPKK